MSVELTDMPAPYSDEKVRDRPDLVAWLGPTVRCCKTGPLDSGASLGIAVAFLQSGLQYAVRCTDLDAGVSALAAFIAEFPYGMTRHGQAWRPR